MPWQHLIAHLGGGGDSRALGERGEEERRRLGSLCGLPGSLRRSSLAAGISSEVNKQQAVKARALVKVGLFKVKNVYV